VRLLSYLSLFFIGLALIAPQANAAKSKGNPKYASIIMDAETGMILSSRYADKKLHPASLTKVMTLLLTFDALERGDIRLRDRVRISKHAASMVPSKLGLPVGSSIRVEDAIYALVTKSANDVAVALAEHLGGTESRFARYMTGRAKGIGMTNTRFMNASGLHHSSQVSTARDQAKMARYIIRRYPKYYRYFSTRSFTYRGKTYRNHNRLMSSYQGMDGFKTGYINAAGFNLIASARKDGRRLIGVVFGGKTGKSRNAHMASIMDAGFKKAKRTRFAKVKMETAPLPNRKPGSIIQVATAQQPNTSKSFVQNPRGFTNIDSIGTGGTALASASSFKANANEAVIPNYGALSKALSSAEFQTRIGQGDSDAAVSKRLETGLIALSVHKGDYKSPEIIEGEPVEASSEVLNTITPDAGNEIKTAALTSATHQGWSIQIGAFGSRLATDQKLYKAKRLLPAPLTQKANSVAVPLRTAEGLIFRARLKGFNQAEAQKACTYFKNCMLIAPIQ